MTDRESDSGFNRLLGPDFQWRPNETNQLSGQFLVSDTQDQTIDPNARAASDHATLVSYRYRSPSTGLQLDYQRLGHDFRADNGFIPQVGVERKTATVLKNFYPDTWLSLIEPGFTADSTDEIGAGAVSRATYPYLSLSGKWNSRLLLQYHVREQVRADTELLEYDYLYFQIETKPSQSISGLTISGQLGEQADLVNERVGRGGSLALNAAIRPTIHLTTGLQAERQWLNIGGERLFTADVAQLKATYNFSSRMFLRFIGEHSRIRRNPGLYVERVPEVEGAWGGSLLFGYQFNWQTALYVGYSDERLLDMSNSYQPGTKTLFAKYALAFER
jgi:hypothetical protein